MKGIAVEHYDYKKFAVRAAIDLLYPESVINRIKAAKSESEISRIMTKAREEM